MRKGFALSREFFESLITRRQAPRKRGNHLIRGSFVKYQFNQMKVFHLAVSSN
jgi:hypothetical protein